MPEGTTPDPVFPLSSSPSNDATNNPTLNSTTIDGDDAIIDINGNNDDTHQKLVMWQGIALLTADCMGVGILGLPNDMKLLGWAVGLSFLVLNCPINYYAGSLLSVMPSDIEMRGDSSRINDNNANTTEIELAATKEKEKKLSSVLVGNNNSAPTTRRKFSNKRKSYRRLPQNQQDGTVVQKASGSNYDGDEKYDVVIGSDCDENYSKNGDESICCCIVR